MKNGHKMALAARLLTTALWLLISMLAGSVASADQLRKVPGTAVELVTPDGFVVANNFSGLVNRSTGGSVIITELPGEAYRSLKGDFSSIEALNARFHRGGVIFTEMESLVLDNGETVPLAHGTQSVNGGALDKWVALYKGRLTTDLVTLQIPKKKSLPPDLVRKIFLSVRIGEPPTVEERLALMPCDLDVFPPFRVVNMGSGHSVLLTVGSSEINVSSTQPIVMVICLADGSATGPVPNTAEAQLRLTSSFVNARIDTRRTQYFAGRQGTFFKGQTTLADGRVLDFVQYFSVGKENSSIRMVAAGTTKQLEELRGAVEKIALSLTFKN